MISRRHTPLRTFTLIELLVVVAIISILAAILLPVLGEARYKAKLVVDMSGKRQIGLGVMSYANDEDDYYPYRSVNMESDAWSQAYALSVRKGGSPWVYLDDRPKFRPYFPVNMLNCDLVPERVDLDANAANGRKYVLGMTSMWFGGEMSRGDEASGRFRVGDRPEWNGKTFDILLSDTERFGVNDDFYISSAHDAGGGYLTREVYDSATQTWTTWKQLYVPELRGAMSKIYLRDDGSGFKLSGIPATHNSLFTKVPAAPRYTTATWWEYLPHMD